MVRSQPAQNLDLLENNTISDVVNDDTSPDSGSATHPSVNLSLYFHTHGNLNLLCNNLDMCYRFWWPFCHDLPSDKTKHLNVNSHV